MASTAFKFQRCVQLVKCFHALQHDGLDAIRSLVMHLRPGRCGEPLANRQPEPCLP